MNQRNTVRYSSELLPGSLGKVTISWQGNSSIGSYVVNCSTQGINLLIPPYSTPLTNPAENDTVLVLMPTDQIWLTGTCIYASDESDGSVSLGIHFHDPKDQTYLKDLLFNTLSVPSPSPSFVKYEWEELVARMCDSDDPQLNKIGQHHLAIIKARQGLPHSGHEAASRPMESTI
jgi:hypothetical protein